LHQQQSKASANAGTSSSTTTALRTEAACGCQQIGSKLPFQANVLFAIQQEYHCTVHFFDLSAAADAGLLAAIHLTSLSNNKHLMGHG
jgi:hypothetical protein